MVIAAVNTKLFINKRLENDRNPEMSPLSDSDISK